MSLKCDPSSPITSKQVQNHVSVCALHLHSHCPCTSYFLQLHSSLLHKGKPCTGRAKKNRILFMKAASIAFVYFRVTAVFLMVLGNEPGAFGTAEKPTCKKLHLQPNKTAFLKTTGRKQLCSISRVLDSTCQKSEVLILIHYSRNFFSGIFSFRNGLQLDMLSVALFIRTEDEKTKIPMS
jgi:hypothetical protein